MSNLDDGNKDVVEQNRSTINMDSLIVKLKNEDSKNLKVMGSFRWIYLAMAIGYVLMVFFSNQDINRKIAGVCYVVAFALFALVFRKLHREFSDVDYSVPLTVLLQKAVERYRLNLKRVLLVLPSVLLIDLGNVLSESFGVDSSSWRQVIIYQVVFFSVMFTSGYAGYLVWRMRQKPLHDSAKQMLEELES